MSGSADQNSQIRRQRGSALIFALIFMSVLAGMALAGVDAALLGTRMALNYRDADRVLNSAEALLMALDAALIEQVGSEGLQSTLEGLPSSEVRIAVPPEIAKITGTVAMSYQAVAVGFDFASTPSGEDAVTCGVLYRLSVQATGRRPGTQAQPGLQRQGCCRDSASCETGDFMSLGRSWWVE